MLPSRESLMPSRSTYSDGGFVGRLSRLSISSIREPAVSTTLEETMVVALYVSMRRVAQEECEVGLTHIPRVICLEMQHIYIFIHMCV